MMRMRTLIVSIIFLVIISIGKADEPLPSPYYEYNVSGYLENTITKKNANYTLQLFGLPNNRFAEKKWIQCRGLNKSGERPYFVTDSTGYFSLKVSDWLLFDSIKIGIVNPQKNEFSNPHCVDKNSLIKYETEYRNDERNGCSSCSSDPGIYKRIEKYIYNYHNNIVTISR